MLSNILLLVLFSYQVLPGEFATITNNRYTLSIALSENSISSVSDPKSFLTSLEDVITRASKALFEATDYKVYFQTVNILLPRSWNNATSTIASSWNVNYLNADIRVEDTLMDDDATPILIPRTHHTKPCGYSGEYIILPPQFFQGTSVTKEFGDPVKVFLHEWAHYRYGVFEEYGYPRDTKTKFPYSFINTKGERQLTSCNDTEIKGVHSTTPGGPDDGCSLDDNNNSPCRFHPDLTATTGPSSSLMSMQFLPTATQFCSSATHDATAPTPHNFWCRNRSVKAVMTRHPDLNGLPTLPSSTSTKPTFSYLTPVPQAVYFLLDVSTHENYPADWFDTAKTKLNTFMGSLSNARSNTPVSLLTMAGTTFSTGTTLGGYVKNVAGPVMLSSATLTSLRGSLNGISRNGGSGLLTDRALMDAADLLSAYTQLSGSIVFVLKLSAGTQFAAAPVESQIISLLNSRNIRLVTVENKLNADTSNLKRISSDPLTDSLYFPVTSASSFGSALDDALNEVLTLVNTNRYQSRRMQVGWDNINIEAAKNVTGAYPVDVKNSELYINIQIPKSVPSDLLSFKMYNTRGVEMLSQSLATLTPLSTSWNRDEFNIYTIHLPSTSTQIVGQYRYELMYTGTDAVKGYVDALEVLPESTDVSIGGGGSPQSRPYNIEVYTSADAATGTLNLGQSGEEAAFFLYASAWRGFASAKATAVQATVYDPNGGSVALLLKDDGIYPDMKKDDSVYTGQLRPTVNGRYRVSFDIYRRNPNVPLAAESSQPFSFALPINQQISNFYCDGDCGLGTSNAYFRRVIPYAAQLTISGASAYFPRPRRILDLNVTDFDEDFTTVSLSWTAPLNSYLNGSVDSYRLVYSSTPNIITDNGLISSTAVLVTSTNVIDGSLVVMSPGSAQRATIQLNVNPCYPLFFTISSYTSNSESYPAPVVFVPRQCDPPDTTTTSSPSTTSPTTKMATSTSPAVPTSASPVASTSTSPVTSTQPRTTSSTTPSSTTVAGTTITATTKTSGADQLSTSFNCLFLFVISVLLSFR